jgi:hypothetical protein
MKQKSTAEGKLSWRDAARIQIHPACELLPPMPPEQVPELGADIRAKGLNEPVVIIEMAVPRANGLFYANDPRVQLVLDGRSRLDGMEAAGIYVVNKQGQLDNELFKRAFAKASRRLEDYLLVLDTDEVDPFAFVISANIHRRQLHLTAAQKRELIEKLLKLNPEKSNRQIAETAKASHVTVGAVRTEIEATGQIDQLTKTTGKDGKARARKKKVAANPAPGSEESPAPAADDWWSDGSAGTKRTGTGMSREQQKRINASADAGVGMRSIEQPEPQPGCEANDAPEAGADAAGEEPPAHAPAPAPSIDDEGRELGELLRAWHAARSIAQTKFMESTGLYAGIEPNCRRDPARAEAMIFADYVTPPADNYKAWLETDPSNEALEVARADIKKTCDALTDLLRIQTPRERAEQQARRDAYEAERRAEEAEKAAERAAWDAKEAARQKEYAEQEAKHAALKDRFRHISLEGLKPFHNEPTEDNHFFELTNKEGLEAFLGVPVDDDIEEAIAGLLYEPIDAAREVEKQAEREKRYKAEAQNPSKARAKSRKDAERDAYKEAKENDSDVQRDDWEWDESNQQQWETDFAKTWLHIHAMEFPNSQYAQTEPDPVPSPAAGGRRRARAR